MSEKARKAIEKAAEAAGLTVWEAHDELNDALTLNNERMEGGELIPPMRETEAACRAYIAAVEEAFGPKED